jgi:hypothetical protein
MGLLSGGYFLIDYSPQIRPLMKIILLAPILESLPLSSRVSVHE